MTMSKDFLEKQKKALLVEKERLEKRLAKLKDFPDYGWDPEDNIRELIDYENNLSFEKQAEYLLGKINKALKSIDRGTYGKCKICRENIEQGRLKIMPYAEVCASCKSSKRGSR